MGAIYGLPDKCHTVCDTETSVYAETSVYTETSDSQEVPCSVC